MHTPNTRNFRSLMITSAIACISVVLATILVYSVHGDDLPLYLPPAPSVPTHDTNITISGDATAQAWDERDEAIAAGGHATATAAAVEAVPDPKKQFIDDYASPVPVPVETSEAGRMPTPANGIAFIEAQQSAWISEYHLTNTWSGTVNGTPVIVWAGSAADTVQQPQSIWTAPEQGVVIYTTDNTAEQVFKSPTRHGILTLTASNGTCLTLQATDSTTYEFNAVAQTWTCTSSTGP